MKEEIERILKGNNVDLGGVAWDDLVGELQRLLLSKQIELLTELFGVNADLTDIWEKKERLESELKQLQ